MTTHFSKRIFKGSALLVALGLSACSFVATPPDDLVARNDHRALAAWYQNEAARLYEKAKEMDQMVEVYQRDPERAEQMMSHGSRKANFGQECKTLAASYRNAGREGETLANSHRELIP